MSTARHGVGALVVCAAAATVLAGCGGTVTGTAQAVPSPAPPSPAPSSPALSSPTPRSALPLVDAGLADDCLVSTEQAGLLLGEQVQSAEQTAVTQTDTSVVDACYYLAAREGFPVPVLRSQVYTVDPTSDVATVMGQLVGDPLTGVGDAAVVVQGARSTTLWVAAGARIATVLVLSTARPSDDAFRFAGRLAVTALATR